MTKKYIRINEDGMTELVVEETSPRSLSESIVNQLAAESTRSINKLFLNSLGTVVSGAFGQNDSYLITRLPKLNLNTCFKLDDGLLTPMFIHEHENKLDYPSYAAEWFPPANMRIMFVSRVTIGSRGYTIGYDQQNYLLAMDEDRRTWKLPLANIFETGAVCMGEFNGYAGPNGTLQEVFELAIKQFMSSKWNSDLSPFSEQVKAMFSYRMVDSNMVQEPMQNHWTSYCTKVGGTLVSDMLSGGSYE